MKPVSGLRDLAVKAGGLKQCDRMPRTLCLVYEIGDLAKTVHRMETCEALQRDTESFRAYRAEAGIAIADAVTQLRLLAYELGYDWDDRVLLGEDRFVETMQQITKGERE